MKILNPNIRLHRLIARWRMLHSFCPRCNSDAPGVYDCAVCKQIHIDTQLPTVKNNRNYPVNMATKALWWYSWVHPGHDEIQKKWSGFIGN